MESLYIPEYVNLHWKKCAGNASIEKDLILALKKVLSKFLAFQLKFVAVFANNVQKDL